MISTVTNAGNELVTLLRIVISQSASNVSLPLQPFLASRKHGGQKLRHIVDEYSSSVI